MYRYSPGKQVPSVTVASAHVRQVAPGSHAPRNWLARMKGVTSPSFLSYAVILQPRTKKQFSSQFSSGGKNENTMCELRTRAQLHDEGHTGSSLTEVLLNRM